MRFKIVSVGGTCAQFMEWTLASIEEQSVDNWDHWATYDPSPDDGAGVLKRWRDERAGDPRWNYTLNTQSKWAVRNQVETIEALEPEDEDIIVFLDLDGDKFAHRDVLAHLGEYYADGTLLTYGSYTPVPSDGNPGPAKPFPEAVVQANSYRSHILSVECCFNHLRTISGKIFNNMPMDQFRFAEDGPRKGSWYDGGTDYVFMASGLELAGGKYKCIPEVLCLYNNANPRADYLTRGTEATRATQEFLRRPPLAPLP